MVLHFRPGATWLLVLVLLAPPLWGHDEAALETALESPGGITFFYARILIWRSPSPFSSAPYRARRC